MWGRRSLLAEKSMIDMIALLFATGAVDLEIHIQVVVLQEIIVE